MKKLTLLLFTTFITLNLISQSLTLITGKRFYEHHSAMIVGGGSRGANGSQSGYDFVNHTYYNSFNPATFMGWTGGQHMNIDMVEHNGIFTGGNLGITSDTSSIWNGQIKGNSTTHFVIPPSSFNYSIITQVSDILNAYNNGTPTDTIANISNGVILARVRNSNYYVAISVSNTTNTTTNQYFDFSYKYGTYSGLVVPNLYSPQNNAINIAIDTSIGWFSVSPYTKYDYQIGTSSTLSGSPIIHSNSNIVPITGLMHNTIYYWRVRSKITGDSSNWSAIRNFTTKMPPLAIPTLTSPSNSSSNIRVDTTLSWQPIANATNYTYQYSTSSAFSSASVYNTSSTNVAINNLLYNTKYYWRVKSKTTNDSSNWSTIWEFTTKTAPLSMPVLTSPSNLSTNIKIDTTLSWQSVSNATNYDYQYSVSSDFSNAAVYSTTSTSAIINNLLYNTKYYWRVKSKTTNDSSDWSTIWEFTTKIAPLSIPALTSPSSFSTNIKIDTILSWQPVSNANNYDYQYSVSSNFSSAKVYSTSSTSAIINNLLYNTKYYWRVKSKTTNDSSDWSATWEFTTITSLLSIPILISPNNNTQNINIDTTIKWMSIQNALSYEYQYSTSANFGGSPKSSTTQLSANLSNLLYNTQYYWRVRARASNDTSNWSTIFRFKTKIKSGSNQIIDLNQASYSIYSVPLSDKLIVNMNVPVNYLNVELIDLFGRQLKSMSFTNQTSIDINTNPLTKGVYILLIKDGNRIIGSEKIKVE